MVGKRVEIVGSLIDFRPRGLSYAGFRRLYSADGNLIFLDGSVAVALGQCRRNWRGRSNNKRESSVGSGEAVR